MTVNTVQQNDNDYQLIQQKERIEIHIGFGDDFSHVNCH